MLTARSKELIKEIRHQQLNFELDDISFLETIYNVIQSSSSTDEIISTYNTINATSKKHPRIFTLSCQLIKDNDDTWLTHYDPIIQNTIRDALINQDYKTYYEAHIGHKIVPVTMQHNNTNAVRLWNTLYNNDDSLYRLLYNNPFISLDIHEFAEQNNLQLTTYNNDNITIRLHYIDNPYPIEPLLHICRFMRRLVNKDVSIDVTILLSDRKKQFNGDTIGPYSVNGGSSVAGRYINIWRTEELEKVLIHELIHYLGIDFNYRTPGYRLIDNYYREFGINDSPAEAFTEALAVIIHTVFIAWSTGYGADKVPSALKYEQGFSKLQAHKVLKILDDRMHQTTNAYSYYIVKAALLNQSFVSLAQRAVLNGWTSDLMREYTNMARMHQDIVVPVKVSSNASDFVKHTARMTCLSIVR